jgi:hypothetical protein
MVQLDEATGWYDGRHWRDVRWLPRSEITERSRMPKDTNPCWWTPTKKPLMAEPVEVGAWHERWTSKRDCWRKTDRGHMKESCKHQKWAPSRISFVKMSVGLIQPGTWRICKEASLTWARCWGSIYWLRQRKKGVSRLDIDSIRKLWWLLMIISGGFILNEWNKTSAHHVGFHTIP